jgi:hypothetical protein
VILVQQQGAAVASLASRRNHPRRHSRWLFLPAWSTVMDADQSWILHSITSLRAGDSLSHSASSLLTWVKLLLPLLVAARPAAGFDPFAPCAPLTARFAAPRFRRRALNPASRASHVCPCVSGLQGESPPLPASPPAAPAIEVSPTPETHTAEHANGCAIAPPQAPTVATDRIDGAIGPVSTGTVAPPIRFGHGPRPPTQCSGVAPSPRAPAPPRPHQRSERLNQ